MIAIQLLGQVGCRLALQGATVYVDPYLTDAVAEAFGERFRRMRASPLRPQDIRDADWILLTHAHMDHCDVTTILPIMESSAGCRVLAPLGVVDRLAKEGVDRSRMQVVGRSSVRISDGATVSAVPSAHPEIELDGAGNPVSVGWLIESGGLRIYHAGDTALTESYFEAVRKIAPIDVAMLPVNETNFFRTREGIVGNMSLREAFGLAVELDARTVVPLHWDLFVPNSVYAEEIELVHRLGRYPFALEVSPEVLP